MAIWIVGSKCHSGSVTASVVEYGKLTSGGQNAIGCHRLAIGLVETVGCRESLHGWPTIGYHRPVVEDRATPGGTGCCRLHV